MAVGTSGRIVIEVDPEFKQALYDVLRRDGRTLKDWFSATAERYVANHHQPELMFGSREQAALAKEG